VKIKVCGLKDAENIKDVTALQPDYMGFIYYGLSPRYVSDTPAEMLKQVPASIHTTAVVVNEKMDVIDKLIDQYHFDTVQLHGSESPSFAEQLRSKVTVFKAFGISDGFDFSKLKDYADAVDFFLFDAKTKAHGGSGVTFNWELLNEYNLNVPYFLSGGLSLDNLGEVKQIEHPQFYGIDLNSRFETEPGIKDVNKLRQAFKTLGRAV
jgi:phosphoribosylanthranilate isomerase